MDFVDEDAPEKKIIQPTLDRLEHEILPAAIANLEASLRKILDGATVTVTINLRAQS